MKHVHHATAEVATHPSTHSTGKVEPKYVTARTAAEYFGVHRDFFRKTPEIRRHRIELNRKTHLYCIAALDEFFRSRRRTG